MLKKMLLMTMVKMITMTERTKAFKDDRIIRKSLNKFPLSTHGNKLRKTIDFCMYEKGSS